MKQESCLKVLQKEMISWATMIDEYVQVKQLREALMIIDLASACGQAVPFYCGFLKEHND